MATTKAWSAQRVACIATYNILEGDQLLNQFESFMLRFAVAGAKKLSDLPYFPKFGAAAADIEGRADQMSRMFLKHLVAIFTNRKERAADSVEQMHAALAKHFESTSSTMLDLANTADDCLRFKDE